MNRPLALAALALAAGCASSLPATERGDLVRGIVATTVQLRAEREGGGRRAASGVVVASDPASRRAWIVTARHFVHPPRRQDVMVRQPGRRTWVKASIAFVSSDLDLALVEVAGLDLVPARLRPTAALGDEILLVAFP